jgi:hypothetical protein
MVQIGLNATIHTQLVPPTPAREKPSVRLQINLALDALGDWTEITDEAYGAAHAVISAYQEAQRPERTGKRRVPTRIQVAQQIVRDSFRKHDLLTHETRRGIRIGHDVLEAANRQMSAGTDYPIYWNL